MLRELRIPSSTLRRLQLGTFGGFSVWLRYKCLDICRLFFRSSLDFLTVDEDDEDQRHQQEDFIRHRCKLYMRKSTSKNRNSY